MTGVNTMKPIYLVLKEDMIEHLDTLADAIGTTRTAIIKQLLYEGLYRSELICGKTQNRHRKAVEEALKSMKNEQT